MNMLALTIIILLIIAVAFTWGSRWGLKRGFRKGYKSGCKVGESQGFIKAIRSPGISDELRAIEAKPQRLQCTKLVICPRAMPQDEVTALHTLTVHELCTNLGTALMHSGLMSPRLIKTEHRPNGDTVNEIGISVYVLPSPEFDSYPTLDYHRRNNENIW